VIDETRPSFIPAIMEAIYRKDESHLRDIISRIPKSDRAQQVNEFDRHGKTPLLAAASTNRIGLVDALLAAGADPCIYGRTTPLIAAVWVKDTTITEHLLNAGARINDQSPSESWSALHFGALKGTPATVQLLLERGADPTLVNMSGYIAEDIAEGENKLILIAHREREALRVVSARSATPNNDHGSSARRKM
jgi:ankyrin repeat protein